MTGFGVYSRVRFMKTLLVIAFAASSLLRPDLVLCMEPTGDVRMERQEATCCDSEHSVPDVVFRAQSTDDCDGCIDVALATHSLLTKRSSHAPFVMALATVIPMFSPTSLASARFESRTTSPARSARLSTTVIRC